ncbi:RRP15-like protein [Neocloeon triangulifer]|uniref:RRP15-like protein n=1 Tax=Neocloeon triangulifer TaxID=2078957 RepID=UPI00286F3510|nr:RRP15-like protein [Neocloeon triangulifer]XP_059475214.1 RRP15-like protein [Neocloeon triangulifer]
MKKSQIKRKPESDASSASEESEEEQPSEESEGEQPSEPSDIEEENELDTQESPEKRARVDDNSESESDDGSVTGNAGWADAISNVLRTNKPKKQKTLILSRAKKLNSGSVVKEEPEEVGFEIDGEGKEEKEDEDKKEEKPDVKPILTAAQLRDQKLKKKTWDTMCRSKPNVLGMNREKALGKIATRGVIQLLNAVRKQQKDVESQLEEAGSSERKRDKVLKSVDKNSFLDILMGTSKSVHLGRNKLEKDEEVDNFDLS